MKLLSLASRRISVLAGGLWLLTATSSLFSQTSSSNFLVTITLPINGSSFTAPATVQIDALTFDTADDVAAVEFMALPAGGGVTPMYALNLGTVSNGVSTGPHSELFAFTWTNPLPATWALEAEAMRGNGMEKISPPVIITVQAAQVLSVDIASPTNGADYLAPANIPLIAAASESGGGSVADVQFFDGANSLGVVSNAVLVAPPGLPPGSGAYLLTWTNAPVGTHVLTALAVDTNGQSAVSAPVTITVASNFPPVVRITIPPNNADFRAPVNIVLLAYAHDPACYVSSLQFMAGSNSLGFGLPVSATALLLATPLTPAPPAFQTNTIELIWSNAPVGSYALTAVAAANTGLSATSAPVNITVLSPPPPPTNKPPVVSIIASDPIAIAGTNCWSWLGLTNTPPTWSNWESPAAVWRWFTNCGPTDAAFTLHRAGPTNSDLLVAYSIGGTAGNGVDYVALPGSTTIPAGQTEAMITVVPTDDQTNSPAKTVILSLSLSTNSPPDYLPGFPSRAEALIIANEFPLPGWTGALLGDRSFHLTAQGPDGAWFHIDYTTNSIDWIPVCTNQVVNGLIDFADPDAAGSPMRFYRAVPLTNPPSD
jgi:hypothetical protein